MLSIILLALEVFMALSKIVAQRKYGKLHSKYCIEIK